MTNTSPALPLTSVTRRATSLRVEVCLEKVVWVLLHGIPAAQLS